MKFLFRLCALLALLSCLPVAHGQFAQRVARVDIQHIGPPASSDELIRANIRVKPGDIFQRVAVNDDVRNLYATGQFSNIRVGETNTPDGLALTYYLLGNPRLTDISFQGNTRMSDAKLRKKLTSKTGEPLDERKLYTDSREIQKMYEKAGYPDTQVKYVLNVDENAGRGSAVFEVTEGRRIKVGRVEIVGAQAFTERELRKNIKTGRGPLRWPFFSGTRRYKEDQFQEDRDKLTRFYRDQGYIDFEIREVKLEEPEPNRMVIHMEVYEGRQYKVGSVAFTGNEIFSDQEIADGLRALHPLTGTRRSRPGPNGLEMDVGDVFTPQGMHRDEQQVEDFYGSKGYIEVSRRMQVNRIPNTEAGTMDLEFRIDEGQKNYVEKIEIRGNTRTKDRVIRRELAIAPGEVFDTVRVDISKRRLEGLQFFEKVETRPESTEVPYQKNLVIGVEEKNTGNLTAGAGFSSIDSVVGFVELSQGNFDLFNWPRFTGGGQKFRLRIQMGTERQDYLVSFVEPWFLNRKLAFGVDLYHRDLNYKSLESLYDEQRTGGRLSLTRALGSDFLIGSVGYTFEQVGINFNGQIVSDQGAPLNTSIPEALLRDDGKTLLSTIDASIAYDTRNSVTLPNRGQRTELSAVLAGPFGGEEDFYKLEVRTAWYFPGLFSGHVLELGARTGVADSYGRSGWVPFYERYYLGGLDTLRGFRYRSIGPRELDEFGVPIAEPIGGNTYYFGFAEYSLPLIQTDRERGVGVRLAVFYDIGNVMEKSYSWNSDYSDNWGIGLRLNLPIGPLRLDYGIPINYDRNNSGSGRFQFGVGYRREF